MFIDDILFQLKLIRYSPHLKGVDLDQFMQMTDDKDFMEYGIRKEKDCRQLSLCAQSIRRTSFSSVSSTDDSIRNVQESPYSPSYDGFHLPIPTPPLADDSSSTSDSEYYCSLRDSDEREGGEQEWPNSIIKRNLPKYDEEYRRHSLPSLSPPSYCDSILDRRRRHSYTEGSIYKDPNEGKEKLPKYTCTVHKMGKAQAKVEYETPGNKPRRRVWKDVYLELVGTMLKVYQVKPTNTPSAGGYRYFSSLASYYEPFKYSSLYNISLANIKAEVAMDYMKKENVFRITTIDGPQILIKVQTNASVSAWIDKLASGSNIAINLESQRMPRFNAVQVEPFTGWSSSTRLQYQGYLNEDRRRRDTDSVDALI